MAFAHPGYLFFGHLHSAFKSFGEAFFLVSNFFRLEGVSRYQDPALDEYSVLISFYFGLFLVGFWVVMRGTVSTASEGVGRCLYLTSHLASLPSPPLPSSQCWAPSAFFPLFIDTQSAIWNSLQIHLTAHCLPTLPFITDARLICKGPTLEEGREGGVTDVSNLKMFLNWTFWNYLSFHTLPMFLNLNF